MTKIGEPIQRFPTLMYDRGVLLVPSKTGDIGLPDAGTREVRDAKSPRELIKPQALSGPGVLSRRAHVRHTGTIRLVSGAFRTWTERSQQAPQPAPSAPRRAGGERRQGHTRVPQRSGSGSRVRRPPSPVPEAKDVVGISRTTAPDSSGSTFWLSGALVFESRSCLPLLNYRASIG